jgi:hypothetical protein
MTWFRNNPGKLKPKALVAPICKTSRRDHPSQKRTPRGLTKRSMAGSFWQGFGTGLCTEPHQRQGRLKQAKKRFEQAWSAFASLHIPLRSRLLKTYATGQPTARQPAFSNARTTEVKNFPTLVARDSAAGKLETVASLLSAQAANDRQQYGLVILENRLAERVPFC